MKRKFKSYAIWYIQQKNKKRRSAANLFIDNVLILADIDKLNSDKYIVLSGPEQEPSISWWKNSAIYVENDDLINIEYPQIQTGTESNPDTSEWPENTIYIQLEE